MLNRCEQAVARGDIAIPFVHAGHEHVGIRVAINAHHGNLLSKQVPSGARVAESLVEPALLCFTHHRSPWLERLRAHELGAASARLRRAVLPRVEDIDSEQTAYVDTPVRK